MISKKKLYLIFKRIFDIAFAITLLTVTLPILIVIAILIKIEDPKGPIFFRQDRGGKNNSLLRIIKFRTMIVEREKNGQKLNDAARLLKIGRIIRKLSFDELPQIVNILRGEMSFIGPRPLSYKFLPYYTEEELHRHDVTPGISGWAQVNGRNFLSWEEKFTLDLYYVDNISFMIDFRIFFITIFKIFFPKEVGVLGKDVESKPLPYIRKPRIDS